MFGFVLTIFCMTSLLRSFIDLVKAFADVNKNKKPKTALKTKKLL